MRALTATPTVTTVLVGCGLLLMGACSDGWQDPPVDPSDEEHSPGELDPAAIPGRFALILEPGTIEAEVATLASAHALSLTDFDAAAGLALLEGRAVEPALPLLDALGADPIVAWAEPDITVELDLRPSDWKAPMWAFHNTGHNDGTEGADISAFNAWDESLGTGVVIALVDSGVDADHTDLGDRLWVNTDEIAGNNIDDDGNGYVDDIHGWDFAARDADPSDEVGHGSSVAGVVVGRGNDGAGILGTAWGSRLMVLRAVAATVGGESSAFAIARSFRYAADNGAQIVLAALSTSGRSRVMEKATRHLETEDILLVTSAGNVSRNLDEEPLFPACWDMDNIVVVTASDNQDRLAHWSGHGPGCVDLAAPGENIITAFKTAEDGGNR